MLANAEPLGHLRNRVAPLRDLRDRVTLEIVREMSRPHHGLLASKLGKKASTNLGAIQGEQIDAAFELVVGVVRAKNC